ncbi:hypothetical protein, partial [Enterococcus faecium]
KSAWWVVRLQQERKNANESANADLDKTVAQRDLAFYNKFRDIPVSLFGVIRGKELPLTLEN